VAADNSRRRKALVPQRLLAEHFADAVDWRDLAALGPGSSPGFGSQEKALLRASFSSSIDRKTVARLVLSESYFGGMFWLRRKKFVGS
jgi:hypothetical protein